LEPHCSHSTSSDFDTEVIDFDFDLDIFGGDFEDFDGDFEGFTILLFFTFGS